MKLQESNNRCTICRYNVCVYVMQVGRKVDRKVGRYASVC